MWGNCGPVAVGRNFRCVDDDVWTEFVNFRIEKQAYRDGVLAGIACAIFLELIVRLAELGFEGRASLLIMADAISLPLLNCLRSIRLFP